MITLITIIFFTLLLSPFVLCNKIVTFDISKEKGMYIYFDPDNESHSLFMYKRYSEEDLKKKLPISYDATKGDYLLCHIVNHKDFIGQGTLLNICSILYGYPNQKISKHHIYHSIKKKFPLLTKDEFDTFMFYVKKF